MDSPLLNRQTYVKSSAKLISWNLPSYFLLFGTLVFPMMVEKLKAQEISVQTPSVGISVAIHSNEDFYEPLRRHGRWETVGAYGRCWIPVGIEADWRPYSSGSWELTDDGWYWVSDEPWAWATYHYGRWDLSPSIGWYWVPRTVWAPSWVSWHRGGGYVGWAPLHPSDRIQVSGSFHVGIGLISPRAYVFVEERRFAEPVRRNVIVQDNSTVIKKTVNITNIKVVNNKVVNKGPETTIIEKASGKKIQSVPAKELRQRQEEAVVVRERNFPTPDSQKTQRENPKNNSTTAQSPSEADRSNKNQESKQSANPPQKSSPDSIQRASDNTPLKQEPKTAAAPEKKEPLTLRPTHPNPIPSTPTTPQEPAPRRTQRPTPDTPSRIRQESPQRAPQPQETPPIAPSRERVSPPEAREPFHRSSSREDSRSQNKEEPTPSQEPSSRSDRRGH